MEANYNIILWHKENLSHMSKKVHTESEGHYEWKVHTNVQLWIGLTTLWHKQPMEIEYESWVLKKVGQGYQWHDGGNHYLLFFKLDKGARRICPITFLHFEMGFHFIFGNQIFQIWYSFLGRQINCYSTQLWFTIRHNQTLAMCVLHNGKVQTFRTFGNRHTVDYL